jgi:hypothetical protein
MYVSNFDCTLIKRSTVNTSSDVRSVGWDVPVDWASIAGFVKYIGLVSGRCLYGYDVHGCVHRDKWMFVYMS